MSSNEEKLWEWDHGWLRQPRDKSKQTRVVVKIGGSLFSTPGWQQAIQALVADISLSNHSVAILAGGGALVDGLRIIDASSSLPDPLAHDLALEAMEITSQLVATTLKLPLGEDGMGVSPTVLDIRKRGVVRNAIKSLPHSWDTTSDSIAAAVATTTESALLLVKSTPPPAYDIECLAAKGWVDPSFQTACIKLEDIRWVARRQ